MTIWVIIIMGVLKKKFVPEGPVPLGSLSVLLSAPISCCCSCWDYTGSPVSVMIEIWDLLELSPDQYIFPQRNSSCIWPATYQSKVVVWVAV